MVFQILSVLFNHLYNLLFVAVLLTIMLAIGMRVFSYFKITGLRTLEKGLFALAIGIGITGYLIYFIGLVHLLNIWLVMLLLLAAIMLLGREYRTISNWIAKIPKVLKYFLWRVRRNPTYLWLSIPVAVFSIFGLIGAATPETQFDALWYHLTLPKIYILDQAIHYVPGTLLYYSVFPRLTEMMYTLGLLVGNDIIAKLFHFAFGLLFAAATFAVARRHFSAKVGVLAAVVLCTSFDILWLSRTAYIDLASAFFGTLAAFAVLLWVFEGDANVKQSRAFLILSGIMAGLLLATKDWGLAVLPTGVFIIFMKDIFEKQEKKFAAFVKHAAIFVVIPLVIVVPWYIDAYIHTGNPLYPLGSFHSPEDYGTAKNAMDWLTSVWPKGILPFTVQYLSSAFAPLLGLAIITPFVWKKISREAKYIFGFGITYYFVYSFIPNQYYRYSFGGFALLGILAAYLYFELFKNSKWLKGVGVAIIVIPILINFNKLAQLNKDNYKVFAGLETRDAFMNRVVAPNAFAFYDRNAYFLKNFSDGSKGKILTYNLHNLFYVDFPFVAYENKALDPEKIHSSEDLRNALEAQNIHYILFKNSEMQALWDRIGKPFPFEDYQNMFKLEYSQAQDSITLYKLK